MLRHLTGGFRAIALVCLVAAPGEAQPQTVTGSVVDDRTNQPVRDVLIYAESQPFFTNTDAEGRFALALPAGDYTLIASIVGYALLRAPI